MINGTGIFQNPYGDFDIEKVKNDPSYNVQKTTYDNGVSYNAYYKAENGLVYLYDEYDNDSNGTIDEYIRVIFKGESLENHSVELLREHIINRQKSGSNEMYAIEDVIDVYNYSDEGYCTNSYKTIKYDKNADGQFDEISEIEFGDDEHRKRQAYSRSEDINYDGVLDTSKIVKYDDEGEIARTSENICNEYYQGKTYTVDWDGEKGVITDSNNKPVKQFELSKVLNNISTANDRSALIDELKQLPGEALIDVSNEARFDTLETEDNRSCYIGAYDKIFLDSDQIDKSTIIHELGHAIDYRYVIVDDRYGTIMNISQSSDSEEFMDSYNSEMEKYLMADNKKYFEYYNPKTKTTETNGGAYCTRNEHEFFAECYELMMTGNCSSKDCIETYFPNTFELVKDMVLNTRESNLNSNDNNETETKETDNSKEKSSTENILQTIFNKIKEAFTEFFNL